MSKIKQIGNRSRNCGTNSIIIKMFTVQHKTVVISVNKTFKFSLYNRVKLICLRFILFEIPSPETESIFFNNSPVF